MKPVSRNASVLATVDDYAKLASQNKINAKNSWDCDLIDRADEVVSAITELADFKTATSYIDTTAKVYSGRVDSVHALAHQVSGSIFKQKISGRPDDERKNDQQTKKQSHRSVQTLLPAHKLRTFIPDITQNDPSYNLIVSSRVSESCPLFNLPLFNRLDANSSLILDEEGGINGFGNGMIDVMSSLRSLRIGEDIKFDFAIENLEYNDGFVDRIKLSPDEDKEKTKIKTENCDFGNNNQLMEGNDVSDDLYEGEGNVPFVGIQNDGAGSLCGSEESTIPDNEIIEEGNEDFNFMPSACLEYKDMEATAIVYRDDDDDDIFEFKQGYEKPIIGLGELIESISMNSDQSVKTLMETLQKSTNLKAKNEKKNDKENGDNEVNVGCKRKQAEPHSRRKNKKATMSEFIASFDFTKDPPDIDIVDRSKISLSGSAIKNIEMETKIETINSEWDELLHDMSLKEIIKGLLIFPKYDPHKPKFGNQYQRNGGIMDRDRLKNISGDSSSFFSTKRTMGMYDDMLGGDGGDEYDGAPGEGDGVDDDIFEPLFGLEGDMDETQDKPMVIQGVTVERVLPRNFVEIKQVGNVKEIKQTLWKEISSNLQEGEAKFSRVSQVMDVSPQFQFMTLLFLANEHGLELKTQPGEGGIFKDILITQPGQEAR